jgi:hypothetical protein
MGCFYLNGNTYLAMADAIQSYKKAKNEKDQTNHKSTT